jgi:hypothetical protein
MPQSTGISQRHKPGTGNGKISPHKRKIPQSNNAIGSTKQPKGNPSESLLLTSSRNILSILVSNINFLTIAVMTQQRPKFIVTPPPPPTADDATTSLAVEFYRGNLHMIVTSI